MAPGCAVSVKKVGEIRFDGEFGSELYTAHVGEMLPFRSKFTARYYVGDSRDYSLSPTVTWYRIGANSAVPEELGPYSTINYQTLTEADIGTWQYYLYAELDAYGVKLTARSNFATITVSRPSPIAGSATHGYIKDLSVRYNYTIASDTVPGFTFEEGKTDYAINSPDNNATEYIYCNTLAGKNLWYGVRVDGIWKDSDTQIKATNLPDGLGFALPRYTDTGATRVLSVIIGTKYDSNQNGSIDNNDEFDPDDCDVYNFTVTEIPALTSITLKDGNGSAVTLSDTLKTGYYHITETSATVGTDTVQLTANFGYSKGVKLYLGNNETPYTAQLRNVEVKLADYTDAKGVANIPLKLVYEGENGLKLENTFTLHVTKALDAANAPVIKTQPAAETSLAKDTKTTLTVETEEPKDGVTLSYQWISGRGSSPVSTGTPVEGATANSIEVAAQAAAGNWYYVCRVTATDASGAVAVVYSDTAKVTTELTYVNPPTISIQPGLVNNKNSTGVYRTEYTAGAAFDPMWYAVNCSSKNTGDHHYIYCTEPGCGQYEIKFYYNTTPSVEGAIEVPGEISGASNGGKFGWYGSFKPSVGLPEGENYVFFIVTSTSETDPTKSASTVSDFVKLTYHKAEYGFDGDGSETNPYLLKTGDDFVVIQKQVNEANNTFAGVYFKLANDITLPADWVSIGASGANGSFFSGTLDGGGFQLSYSDHSQPLFKYVSRATIKNLKLYGKEIQGAGLIDYYWIDYNVGAWISNVTLVSGTSTLDAGLIRGASSSMNPSYIKNCVAEEGVIIGYDKTASGIGSFAGGYVGTIENCRSAATVYGTGNIGGMAGSKSNSMGLFDFKNCTFTGKIEASGSFVGGIAGCGYVSNSAPNATCTRIQNCYVNAEITGKSAVGGIYGGEGGVDQCWDNGIGYIRNNVFYGKLTVTNMIPTEENIGGSKGGIVGYMRSLNRYNVIENNFYYDANGTTKAIGGVEHIDTSTHEFGFDKDENIFYYNTSKDSIADIKEWVDREDKGTSDWQWTSVPKTDHNRDDDPMGKDNSKLGRACTVEEMKDGTVVKLLNDNENSMKNWEQGETTPVISNKATVSELKLSGSYKTEYYIGDTLDMTGAVFTAVWSDGTETTVATEDVIIEGFDSSTRAVLTLKASYNSATCEFTVKVLKKGGEVIQPDNNITVYFTLLGDDIHGDPTEETGTHTLKDNNLKTWLARKAYTVDMNATVWDLLLQVEKENAGVKFSNPKGNYVDYVTFDGVTIGEFDNGQNSGWMYTLNGKHPLLGVAEQFLDNGNEIVFHYTDDYTVEEGSEPWNGGGNGSGGSTTDDKDEKAAEAVDKLIDAIGTVTKDSRAKIDAARAAYDKLTDAQKKLVKNYDKLVKAESDYAKLVLGVPFVDVEKHWALDAIKYAYEKGLMNGVEDDKFAPNATLTRGMLVTVLYRMAGAPEVTGEGKFADVAASDWYAAAVKWAADNGIVDGVSDSAFAPKANITREQLAAMLYRFAQYMKYASGDTAALDKFEDAASVSDWAEAAMQWAVGAGLVSGRTDTTIVPGGTATRAEAATLLMRFMENVAK